MAATQTDELSLRDLLGGPQAEHVDLSMPALFIAAAAFILGYQNPINYGLEAHTAETLVLALAGSVVLGWGVLRRRNGLFFAGSALLILTIAASIATQPSQLGTPPMVIWPLRMLIVLLVVGAWAFLLRPPNWLRRAFLAIAIPTLLMLALWGGPAMTARLLGLNFSVPPANFAPYWLAADSKGTLYVTDADGNLIWVFNQSGEAVGTIRPNLAPIPPTPGPGIMPVGYEARLDLPGAAPMATATPNINTPGVALITSFTFCGIATDPQDNLYTVDSTSTNVARVLRFDRNGDITARWDAPEGYEPTRGCIAADADYVYVAARQGKVYALDHSGKAVNEWTLEYQPFGVTAAGSGKIEVMGPGTLSKIDVASGNISATTLPAPLGELQIPYQALLVDKAGHTLVTDLGSNKILRINSQTGDIISTIGGVGDDPGQFRGLGGLTYDGQGRLYVSDWQHRVIQRFTAGGEVDAIWWARRLTNEVEGEGEQE